MLNTILQASLLAGALSAAINSTSSSVINSSADPVLVLPYSTFQGSNANGVSSFKGMPFAQPPIGDLRLRYPVVPPKSTTGIQSAKHYGPSCIQQKVYSGNFSEYPPSTLAVFVSNGNGFPSQSEDCLTINVQMPKGTKVTDKLPIVAWIYGGAFEVGGTSIYDGSPIVQRSVVMGTPIIFVSMNYRVNAFGFLGGKEVGAAGLGNLGLVDQREGLRWINKYAHLFGGDSSKVTLFGESAGAVSVASQMLTNKGNPEGLFRASFVSGGAALPVGKIEQYQPNFDRLARDVGCSNSSTPLDCIRNAPLESIIASVNSVPGVFSSQGMNFVWSVSGDGTFLRLPPQQLLAQGEYAKIPHVNGDCDDEGTLFSFTMPEIQTDAHFKTFVQDLFLPTASESEISSLLVAYPNTTAMGSPFNTGDLNALTPQFKRISSLQGDLWFHAPRRFMLGIASGTQPTWSWLWKRVKATEFLGAYHSADLGFGFFSPNVGSLDKQFIDYLINFIVKMDPNDSSNPNLIDWPQWSNSSRTLLELFDLPAGKGISGNSGLKLSLDNFRSAPIDLVTSLFLKYPFATTYDK